MINRNLPKTITVTVASGSGDATFIQGSGVVIAYAIKPASTVAVYDCELFDGDDYGLTKVVGVTGYQNVKDIFQIDTTVKVQIRNATVDGTYTVRLWYSF